MSDPATALTGDAIEVCLSAIGHYDPDTFAICVSADVTAAEMAVVTELVRRGHDPAPELPDGGTDCERWNSLFCLVTDFGLGADQIVRFRAAGLSDFIVLYAAGTIGRIDVVTALVERGHDPLVRDSVAWVRACKTEGIPVEEIPTWADAGFVGAADEPWRWVPQIALWRERVGPDAAACAAAGLSLTEAVTLGCPREVLALMGGLRQAG